MQKNTSTKSSVDFRELAIQIRDAGLLDRTSSYYAVKIAFTVAAFVAGWTLLVLVGNSWIALAVAFFLGIMFTQLGFIGHDAGHQQVFRTRRANGLLGLGVGNALIGVSFGWWVPKHSAHHAHPNEIGMDPDLDASLVPASRDLARTPATGIGAFLHRHQAYLYFPLMVFRSTGLHVLGIARLVRLRDRTAAIEALLIALHALLYLTIVFWVLSPLKAVAFIAVQQVVFSIYLGCSFAPNHKAMPVLDKGVEMSFAERQVRTARNVTGGRLTGFLLGGLNFQIEHHLFPSMPRPNLRRAQPLVQRFCLDSGFGYHEDSFAGTFRQIVRQLGAVSAADLLTAR